MDMKAHCDHRGQPQGKQSSLGVREWLAVMVPVLVLLAFTVPRLPQGICFGDSGGIQLAAATRGITHPPGYVLYTSILHVLTWVLPFDAAYDVSLSCLASGLGVVAICTLIQIRLGVDAWLAAAVSLLFTIHPRVWSNFLTPEVYMPTLFFEALSVYWLIQFAETKRRRWLWLGALSIGIALANRPPVVFFLAFVVVAVTIFFISRWRSMRSPRRDVAIAIFVLVIPIIYTGTCIFVRDRPGTVYNYIEQYNAEAHCVPSSDLGFGAKCERMFWLVSGAQFRSQMGNTWSGLKSKMRWLGYDLRQWLGVAQWGSEGLIFPTWLIVVLAGVSFVWSKNWLAAVILIGLAVKSILFVCLYRIHGGAANTLPLLFTCSVLVGISISRVLQLLGEKPSRITSAVILGITIIFTIWHVPTRREYGREVDATTFQREFDLNSLPPNTVICTIWETSGALYYAKHVTHNRPDITIINASYSTWPRMLLPFRNRPIIAVESSKVWYEMD